MNVLYTMIQTRQRERDMMYSTFEGKKAKAPPKGSWFRGHALCCPGSKCDQQRCHTIRRSSSASFPHRDEVGSIVTSRVADEALCPHPQQHKKTEAVPSHDPRSPFTHAHIPVHTHTPRRERCRFWARRCSAASRRACRC